MKTNSVSIKPPTIHDFKIQTLDELLVRLIEIIDYRLMMEGPSFNFVYEIGMDVRYSKHVANTHAAPRGQRINFFSRPNEGPTGFPGWTGEIAIAFHHSPSKFGSNYFNQTGVYTGTGGYTHLERIQLLSKKYKQPLKIAGYQWSATLFQEDFPDMAKQLQIQEMEALLEGTTVDEMKYVFAGSAINPRLDYYRRQLNELDSKKRVPNYFG